MMVQVIRPFPSDEPVKTGQILDATDWPVNRVRQLTRFRYVQPVAVAVTPQEQKATRKAVSP